MNKKIIILTIVLMMVLSSTAAVSISTQQNNTQTDNEESGFLVEGYRVDKTSKIGTIGEFTKYLAKRDNLGTEIIDKRTTTDRHFKNDDGTITAYMSISPNCYQDENGVWHDGIPGDDSSKPKFGSLSDNEESISETSNYYGQVDWHSEENGRMQVYVYRAEDEIKRYSISVGQCAVETLLWDKHKFYRSFAQWDISSLPPSLKRVTKVELSFYVSSEYKKDFHNSDYPAHRKYADLMIYDIADNAKPSNLFTSTGSDPDIRSSDENSDNYKNMKRLMDDCDSGFIYKSATRVNKGDGTKTWTLEGMCNQALFNSIEKGWFAIGFKDDKENIGKNSAKCGGVMLHGTDSPSESRLVLEITYEKPDIKDCAVFIVGGCDDHLQACFLRTAKYGMEAFEYLGYEEGETVFLKNKPSWTDLRDFIKNTLPNKLSDGSNLFIYLDDHGFGSPNREDWLDYIGSVSEGHFLLNPDLEKLDWNDLKRWLADVYNQVKYRTCTIVVEACFSGHFIVSANGWMHQDDDSAPYHIIITGSDEDHVSYGKPSGYSLFSPPFFDALKDGKSYGEAWEIADAEIYKYMKDIKDMAKSFEKGRHVLATLLSMIRQKINGDKPLLTLTFDQILKLKPTIANILNALENRPMLVPYTSEWLKKNWNEQFRNVYLQSPCLSDDGDKDYAGTKGKNEKNTLPEDGNGRIADKTYP
jgi:hypothetical protein